MTRRIFNQNLLFALPILKSCVPISLNDNKDSQLKLSLAQWSFHRTIRSQKMDHLDFAIKAKSMGFDAIEYVNQFFPDKATDYNYLNEMNTRASRAGVKQLLIMVDEKENLSDLNKLNRLQAIEDHKKWIDAAAYLNCHSIRVNLYGNGDPNKTAEVAVDSLTQLCAIAKKANLNILVENHGQLSSHGKWLAQVISKVNLSNCGTLPDFANFCVEREGGALWSKPCINEYDKYKGIEELMPYAKAVSSKSFDFDENGQEINIDFERMMKIIKAANYKGYISIEYEGDNLSEEEGILKTKRLLEQYL
ncbi:MAG: sugar phosphate isomerase/epimerase [Saprospiraceae bacterium]|nr:sugar phosphate isomerase/epimerase [Bacteroidia bacterium]NNL93190.1 sugar phosphate isomerase/epimerase [Saprospiraceae bacterium]